jgi:hypothetical protein
MTFESEHLLLQIKSILQKIIKRTHIIIKIWWEKNKENKDLLTTFKNHSYPKICEILKLQKFKELSKILKLQKSFTTYKWGIMYMMF